jgi:hypothetical protein
VIHVDAGIGPVHRHAEHDLARETRDGIGADRPDPVVRHGVLDQPEAPVASSAPPTESVAISAAPTAVSTISKRP